MFFVFFFRFIMVKIFFILLLLKRNPKMVEWLLSNEILEPYRDELLTATATGDFFKR